jgi:3-deoxy-D-manno-octulosonic-acid transferase
VVHGAARQPNDELGLTTTFDELFRDPEERARLVAAAREVLAPHRGATARTAALLEKLSAPAS